MENDSIFKKLGFSEALIQAIDNHELTSNSEKIISDYEDNVTKYGISFEYEKINDYYNIDSSQDVVIKKDFSDYCNIFK